MTAKVLLAIHNVHVYEKWLQEYQGNCKKKEENGKNNEMVEEKRDGKESNEKL